ncbi:hypothetical protein CRYUN_Cryun25bG0062500 [Craigia yunnanensis]
MATCFQHKPSNAEDDSVILFSTSNSPEGSTSPSSSFYHSPLSAEDHSKASHKLTPKPVEILKSVSFVARSSEILAIIGPSGTGKSSLLRKISGRVYDKDFDPCSISINDHRMISPAQLRKICGFVAQEDNLLPLLTVRETLIFSAKFRLKEMSSKEKEQRVESLMQELGLLHVADSFVGDQDNRGISGGERKSLELLEEIIQILGFQIPTQLNALEFAMEIMPALEASSTKLSFVEDRDSYSYAVWSDEECSRIQRHNYDKEMGNFWFPNLLEIMFLCSRFWKIIYRTKQLFLARTMQAVVGGFGLGSVYVKIRKDEEGVAERLGLFAFSLSFLLSSTVEALPVYLQERRVLMKEASRGAYRISSYVIANTIVFMPFLFAVSILFSVPVYWIVGLNPSIAAFTFFTFVVWLIILMASSLVLFLSSVSPDFISGNSLICTVLGAFFLFSGYFIPRDNIPNYWLFMYYVSLYRK